VKTIGFLNLLVMIIPVAVVAYVYLRWCGRKWEIPYATVRMVGQLIAIGYVLVFLFEYTAFWMGLLVLCVMIGVSSWIAIRPFEKKNWQVYRAALLSIAGAGTCVLLIVVLGVIGLDWWYQPDITSPLAGRSYANAMNTISLSGERFLKERDAGCSYEDARATAYRACLIPQINTYMAVGLVSLPGLMTGQILAGTSPLIAVRYQIMVMAMILGAAGSAAALFLLQMRKHS
jgi:putative ABC transport system permease protein